MVNFFTALEGAVTSDPRPDIKISIDGLLVILCDAFEIFPHRACMYLPSEPSRGTLVMYSNVGLGDPSRNYNTYRILSKEEYLSAKQSGQRVGTAAAIYATRISRIFDPETDSDYKNVHPEQRVRPYKESLGVPISGKGGCIGVLFLDAYQKGFFVENDKVLVEMAALSIAQLLMRQPLARGG